MQRPGSPMSKAQEFFTDENGHKMWRATEHIPVEPKIEIEGAHLAMSVGRVEGEFTIHNLSPFRVMNAQATMPGNMTTFVVMPPRSLARPIEAGQQQTCKF